MRPNLCYYIQAFGPQSDRPPFPPRIKFFLKADTYNKTVTLDLVPYNSRPANDDSLLWAPVDFMTESDRGFVLQNVGSNLIIATDGSGNPLKLIPNEAITEKLTTWHLVSAGPGFTFNYIESPFNEKGVPLELTVNSYQYPQAVTILPRNSLIFGTWKFIKQGLETAESDDEASQASVGTEAS